LGYRPLNQVKVDLSTVGDPSSLSRRDFVSRSSTSSTSELETGETGFRRSLGLFDSTMLVVGSMIGSGIFIVSVDIARDVGSAYWLMMVWILTGVVTVLGTLCYAELAGMMPKAGGQYIFLREAYSPMWGFLYGWAVFMVIQTGSLAAVGVAFAKYLGVLVPILGTDQLIFSTPLDISLSLPLPWMAEPLVFFERDKFSISSGQLVAVAVIMVLTWVNCRGVDAGKLVQNIFTLAKTAALVILIWLGLTLAADSGAIEANKALGWDSIYTTAKTNDVREMVPFDGLMLAMMVVGGAMVGSLFSADAWNNITFTAGEVKNPKRNVAGSLVLGAAIVIVLYLLANLAYLSALRLNGDESLRSQVAELNQQAATLSDEGRFEEAAAITQRRTEILNQSTVEQRGIVNARDDRVATALVERVSPAVAVPLMAIAIMISTFGCVNGMTLMGARLYYAMSRDRLFFKSVGKLNRRGVPAAGLVLQGCWASLLVFSGTYSELLDYVIFAVLVFYVLTVSGLFVLRYKMPAAERPFRVPLYPILPAFYVLMCAAIMIDLLIVKPVYTWPGLIIVLAGIPIYLIWRQFTGGRAAAESQPNV
jgi:APA family basic amino acid/polyamine antiporter